MLGLTLDDPKILDMDPETVEVTYSMYMEYQNEQWARFERILGTTWAYEDVAKVQVQPAKKEGEDYKPPRLLGPGEKVFYPLAQSLNPALMPMIAKRFQTQLGNVFGDEGIDGNTKSFFDLPKQQFKRVMGQREEDHDEFDVRRDNIKFVPKK